MNPNIVKKILLFFINNDNGERTKELIDNIKYSELYSSIFIFLI